MNERIVKVLRWLKTMPLQDEPRWTMPPTGDTSSTWEEWVSKGKKIDCIEDCLLWVLEHNTDTVTRSSAALALGFVGGARSVTLLIRVLESDTFLVQMEAAASLGRIGNPEAIEPLCKAMKNPDPNVRANICMALGQFSTEKAIAYIKDALKDRDPFVQDAAEEALRGYKKNETGTVGKKRGQKKGEKLT